MASFNSAFAAARKAGKKTFTWNGNSYHTELKETARPKSRSATTTTATAPKPRPAAASPVKKNGPKPRPAPTKKAPWVDTKWNGIVTAAAAATRPQPRPAAKAPLKIDTSKAAAASSKVAQQEKATARKKRNTGYRGPRSKSR